MEEVKEKTMLWYTIRTQNNKEKYVLERLRIEYDVNNLGDCLGQVVIPHEKIVSVRNGKKTIRDKITYPGYVFVETSTIGELKHFLKSIDGAGGLVKSQSGVISPMRQSEVDRILVKEIDPVLNDAPKSTNDYVVGESVLITDGPFQTFTGIIDHIDGEKVRIIVLIFSRKTPVDLLASQIERVHK